ncbi:MAG: hypothetical protein JXR42_04775 [Gammaproteobacteria bacterium]|nr:hypothetical protein [Gammaproteobacteria bacterium]
MSDFLQKKKLSLVIASFLALIIFWNLIWIFINYRSIASYNNLNKEVSSYVPFDLSSYHLFGISDFDLLPETNLNLKLQATFIAKKNSALIIVKNSNPKLYNTESVLMGGVTIYKILSDMVILRHNGKLEKLSLLRPILHFSPEPQDI